MRADFKQLWLIGKSLDSDVAYRINIFKQKINRIGCILQVYLTLEQHRLELHRSIYTQIFFYSKYYSTTQFVFVESVNVETWMWRNSLHGELIINFICRFSAAKIINTLNPCVVQGSTVILVARWDMDRRRATLAAHHIGSFLEIQARDDEGLNQRLDNEDCTIVYRICFRSRTSNISLNLPRAWEELKTLVWHGQKMRNKKRIRFRGRRLVFSCVHGFKMSM